MRAAIVDIGSNKLYGKNTSNISNYISKRLLEIGAYLTKIITCQNTPEAIKETLDFVVEDVVFIIAEDSSVKNFHIKKVLGAYLGEDLVKNNDAFMAVNSFFKSNNQPFIADTENEFFLPETANCIPNEQSFLQSFYISNKQTIYFLPQDLSSVQFILEKFIIDKLIEDYKLNYTKSTIKTYGISENDINLILEELMRNKYKILITTYSQGLENSLVIRHNKDIADTIIDDFISRIYEKLHKFIYADEEVSLSYRVYELLRLTNKTVALAEGATGGVIAEMLLAEHPQMVNYLKESIVCPTKESKMVRLNIAEEIIDKYSEESVEICYEMAAGLLETTGVDVVVCTTGFLNKNSKNNIVYIGIGDVDGIHVYKNIFSGDRKSIMENISKTSLFYLIKKIKQNDLLFS